MKKRDLDEELMDSENDSEDSDEDYYSIIFIDRLPSFYKVLSVCKKYSNFCKQSS